MAKSSRIIDGLKTNTSYDFYLRAKNKCGIWSAVSTAVNHTTLKDTTAPAVLSSITLLMLNGVYQLKWSKPTTLDLRSGGYKVYVYTSDTVASSKLIKEVGYTSDSVDIKIGESTQDASITIQSATTYYFWVTTLDASGNESAKVATTPTNGMLTSDVVVLSTTTGINAKTVGTTNLYTVPTGRTAIITGALIRVTAADAITVVPALGIGIAAGEDDIIASTTLTGLTVTTKSWRFTISGLAAIGASTNVIKLGIDTGATATTMTIAVDLLGFLI